MTLLQAVVIGLLALIITPGYLFYFDVTPKIVVLLAGTGIALLASRAGGRRGLSPSHRLFLLLLILNLLSLSISTALSTNPALSAFGTNWRRLGSVIQAAVMLFAGLIATHTAGRQDRVRTILRAIAVAGSVSAVYGIAQYLGWDPILPAAGYHIGEGMWAIVRPPSTLGYVSYFATWLLFVTFLSLGLAAMEIDSWWRPIAYAFAGLSTFAMLLTGTRAAVLGLLAGAVVWLYSRRKAKLETHNRGLILRAVAAASLLAVAAGAFYFSSAGWRLRSRTRWFVEDPWGGSRPKLWRDSLRMAIPRLAQGYGPEVFTATFPRFESKTLAEAYPDFLYESPHNIFLDALIAQGIPGLLILAALCLLGLQPAGRLPWNGAGDASKSIASTSVWIRAALAAGIVSQQFTVFTIPTAFFFYVTIALGIGLASNSGGGLSREAKAPAPLDWRLTVAIAPLAFVLLYLALRFSISDHALAFAQHRVESGDLPGAAARYEQYRRWNLPGTTADLWYSRALIGLAQKTPDFQLRYFAIAQSGLAAVRATKSAEDPFNAWYNLALLYASQNNSQRTENCLRAAIAANPNWFKPHWTLAQLLRLEHRLEEAGREAETAAKLDAGKNPEVVQTLLEIRAQRTAPEHK